MTAAKRGHEIWYIGAGDFACDPDDALRAHACPGYRPESPTAWRS